MLNPWDLDNIAAKDSQNFAKVEGLIWQYITDVLAKEQTKQTDDTPPSRWQQEMLEHADDVRKYAEQVTGKPQKQAMLTLQTNLGPMTYDNMKNAEKWLRLHTHNPVGNIEDSKQIAKRIEAGKQDGEKYLTIARNNMSENAYTQFNKIVDTAAMDIRNGETSTKALNKAAKQWADQGIPALIDKAGRHWSPDVYVRTVVEASVNNTTNDVELTRYKQYGALVKVSSHAGCRPSHLQFQDQIYSITGDTTEYPDFEATTGYGTVTGVGGIHCRHHALPYVEGEGYIKVPQMNADENAAMYANKQTQRRLESNVRKAKRQQVAAEKLGDQADIDNAKHLVRRRQKAVREFTSEHKLTRRYDRERVLINRESTPNGTKFIKRAVAKTEASEVSLLSKFSNAGLNEKVGSDIMSELTEQLSRAPKDIQTMWANHASSMQIEDIKRGRSHYNPANGMVTLDPTVLSGNMAKRKNDVFYHEFGHMIDNADLDSDQRVSQSAKYQFADALNHDLASMIEKRKADIIKNGLESDRLSGTGSSEKYNYAVKVKHKKDGSLTTATLNNVAPEAIRMDIARAGTQGNWQTLGDISDMIEAASQGKLNAGVGHGKLYWARNGMQETEAFAEMTSATINNPESLAKIKEYFPSAYEKYLEMVHDIAMRGGKS